jgi:Chlorophyll A-B binding protein
MKIALLLSLIASVAAFAPMAQKPVASSTALKLSVEDKPGALAPLGYWDPLNLATSEKLFDQYRAVELKHGRVAMLAVVGFVVPEFYRFGYEFYPGFTTDDVRNGYQALRDVPPLGWVQMIFFVGFVDQSGFLGNFEMVRSSHVEKNSWNAENS